MADAPIIINPSQVPELAQTFLRYVAAPLGGFLVGKGWINADQALQLPGLLLALVAGGWGLYRAYTNKQKLIAIASDPRTPDSVASVSK